ncbi:MAG: hypothetical protein WCD21_29740 [Streptomyces sp.]
MVVVRAVVLSATSGDSRSSAHTAAVLRLVGHAVTRARSTSCSGNSSYAASAARIRVALSLTSSRSASAITAHSATRRGPPAR